MLKNHNILVTALLVLFSTVACMLVVFSAVNELRKPDIVSLETEAVTIETNNNPYPKELSDINTYDVWVPYWDFENIFKSLLVSKEKLNSALPVWYVLDAEGTVIKIENIEEEKIRDILATRNIKIIPTIQNDFDPDRVHEFLVNEGKINNTISYLIDTAKVQGYDGWDIDWEQINESDKDYFVDFIKKLQEEMKKEGLILSVTVHAQTNTSADWSKSKGHDWPGIGKYADEVRLMAYDYHSAGSFAGAVTPMGFLKKVLLYAESVIPKEKTIVSLPFYGYDWVENKGTTVEHVSALALLEKYKITPQRDAESREMYFTYENNGESHEVWYQDSVSIIEKIKVSESMGYSRFCFWRLGGEDLGFWEGL